MRGRNHLALVPVAVAAFLIGLCVAGSELYSSSSGSAALDDQLDETCRADSALVLPVPFGHSSNAGDVEAMGGVIPFTDPPMRGAFAQPLLQTDAVRPVYLRMLWLDGIDAGVTPALAPLADGEIAMSETTIAGLQTHVGGTLVIGNGVQVTVAQSFDDVAFAPVPEFWCGWDEMVTPPPSGDPPPPYAIASLSTIVALGNQAFDWFEFHVSDRSLNLTNAAAIEAGYASAIEAWKAKYGTGEVEIQRNELERIVGRAQAVRTSIDRNLAPVTLTGVLAGGIVLVAAGVLLARDRQRELRLLAVRGLPPWRVAVYVFPGPAAAVAVGTLAGLVAAWATIKALAPSSNLEHGALVSAVTWAAVVTLAAAIVVASVVAGVADRFADAPSRRLGRRVPVVIVALAVVGLAVVAFKRLDEQGGVRTFGVESRGGDLLSMGFPLFGVLAATALAATVVGLCAPRLRRTGGRWPRPIRLGWRRAVLDAGPLVAIVVAAALAAGCFATASALAAGAERQLADKAQVYVGSDLSVDLFDPYEPSPDWADRTTVVATARIKWEGDFGELLGVDPQQFPEVASMRSDGADRSLPALMESIHDVAEGAAPDAIAVGTDLAVGDTVEVRLPGGSRSAVLRISALATFFPRKTTGVPLFVVTSQALQALTPAPQRALLVRDPPPDAVAQIRSQGVRTGVILNADEAFDGSAYSALRWAYAPLATLGVLFAIVALALQLLVVSARRSTRRIADAVMRRTGFTRSGLWWASVVETGVPLALGSIIGVGAATAAASLAVPRLDPMPALAPPAAFAVPWDVLAGIAACLPLWTAVIAATIVRSTVRADPMRVFQGSA